MKNLKAWIVLVSLALMMSFTSVAWAADGDDDAENEPTDETSFLEDVKSVGNDFYQYVKKQAPGWWQSAKDTASSAVDTMKEKGPGWVDTAKGKGSELLGQGKDALQSAGEQVSEFFEDQQDQFWERTERQISGGTTSSQTDEGATPEADDVADDQADDATSEPSVMPELPAAPNLDISERGNSISFETTADGDDFEAAPAEVDDVREHAAEEADRGFFGSLLDAWRHYATSRTEWLLAMAPIIVPAFILLVVIAWLWGRKRR